MIAFTSRQLRAFLSVAQARLRPHSEPDQPFFNIPGALPGSVKLIPLTGPIQLSGTESFEI